MLNLFVCFVKFVPYLLTGIQSGISDWLVWSCCLISKKKPYFWTHFNRQVSLIIQSTWIPVSQPLAWTSCWRWATTSRFTIFLTMLSTIWGTTKMDRALSIPWACRDCVQTWLSLTPTRRMSRGRILTSFKICVILGIINLIKMLLCLVYKSV